VGVAKWSFFAWLFLLALGIILIVVGFEDPGPVDDGASGGVLGLVTGDIQLNFGEDFMALEMLGLLCLNLAWVGSIVAAIVSFRGLRSSSPRKLLVTVFVVSLIYVVLGAVFNAWFWGMPN
jgi:hypothetical protein